MSLSAARAAAMKRADTRTSRPVREKQKAAARPEAAQDTERRSENAKRVSLSLTSSGGSNLFANASDIEEDLAIVQPSRLVIDPTDVPRLQVVWDTTTTTALLFTAAVVPFEVAFLPSPCSALEPLFLASRIVDVIFLMDITLCFFLAVPQRAGGGALETRHSEIINRYLRGWFVPDIVGVLASLLDILPLALGENSSCDPSERSPFVALRAVRMLRLIKLARLFGASRVLARLQVRVGTPKMTFTVVSSLFKKGKKDDGG